MFRNGDIIGVQGRGWLADHIISLTAPGPFSHIAIITAIDPEPQTTEALTRVETHPLSVTLDNCEHAWLISDTELVWTERLAMVEAIQGYSAATYNYEDILWQFADCLFQTRWFTRHLTTMARPICSMLADIGYAKATLHPLPPIPGVTLQDIEPNDFWRLARSYPQRFVQAQLK